MSRAPATLAAIALSAAIASIGCGPGAMPASIGHSLVGAAAPAFMGVSTLDREVGIPARFHTKVTVVDFWASWCAACQESLPALDALWKRHKNDGVMVIGVSVDQNEAEAVSAAEHFHATFPVVLDSSQHISGTYGVGQVPMTFVVDRAQRVRWVGRSAVEASRAVEVLLAE